MSWKRKLLKDCNLYLILDTDVCSYQKLIEIVRKSIDAGVDIVQLRDKKGLAKDILQFSRKIQALLKNRIPYIINDRVDLALACGADGVHLGQDDLSIAWVRKMLGQHALIGASCQTLKQSLDAEAQGADYIGFGSVFQTKTKPERKPLDQNLLVNVFSTLKIPVFAIGGINEENLTQLVQKGIHRVAVCRCICEAKNVRESVRDLANILSNER